MDISTEVRIKDLFAQFLRGGLRVLAAMLIFALLFGGFKLRKEKKAADAFSQSGFAEKQNTYETEKRDLERNIERAETKVEQARLYLEESLIGRIDPYNVARTVCYVSVNLDDSLLSEQALPGEASTAELLTQIQDTIVQRYRSVIVTANLSEFLNDDAYREIPDRFLRELIAFSNEGNGTFSLAVNHATEEESEKMAQALLDALLGAKLCVEEVTYPHTLTPTELGTRRVINNDIAAAQTAQQDALDSNTDALYGYRKQLSALKAPAQPAPFNLKNAVKNCAAWAIIGAIVGLLVAFVWCLIAWLSNNTLLSSYQAEQQLKLAFLGAAAEYPKGARLWAAKLSKERLWKNAETGKRFLKANAGLLLSSADKIVLASSLPDAKASLSGAETVLRELGVEVSAVADANSNPEYLTALGESAKVILALRPGTSSLGMAKELKELCDRAGSTAIGFILI